MSSHKVVVLDEADALELGRDAIIVAFRWDLVPWALVLDLDVTTEGKDSPTRRAWFVFVGMHEITWPPVEGARLPKGLICTSAWVEPESAEGFHKYVLSVLTAQFSTTDQMCNNPHSKIVIRAQELIGASSIASMQFGEFGPNRQERNVLATEDDILQAINAKLKRKQNEDSLK